MSYLPCVCLFVCSGVQHMLCCVCLFVCSGVQHMLCCVCLFVCSGVQHMLCFVFFILCTLCCRFLWIVRFWLPLRYSLMFIYTLGEILSNTKYMYDNIFFFYF